MVSVLRAERLDAVVCAAPENVLLASGYWPVTGVSAAVVTSAGEIVVLAPSDEEELAKGGWADEVVTFEPASMEKIVSTVDVVRAKLAVVLAKLGVATGRIGFEGSTSMRPASYVAQNVYGGELVKAAPEGKWIGASAMLERLREPMTTGEIERLRLSCRIAARAYEQTVSRIRVGMTERAVASALEAEFVEALGCFEETEAHSAACGLAGASVSGDPAKPQAAMDAVASAKLPFGSEPQGRRQAAEGRRAMCFAYCMSGANAYEAFAAYQRSRGRRIENGDLVLVHCNSCVDGFWTDITRTFVVGEADDRQKRIFDAIFAAREAALKAIRPGGTGAQVDAAARQVMREHGFEKEFKHPTGHGVGFVAIDHNARPRIHPVSEDVLDVGMVFNVEPGIYIEGLGGARHCDMVVVSETGYELLTDFLSRPQSVEELL